MNDRNLEAIAMICAPALLVEALLLQGDEKTVQNYVSNIFTKLQVADRAQAIVRAREAGLDRDEG